MSDYRDVIKSKEWKAPACGFEPTFMPSILFDWQRAVVRWACIKGRSALFEDCGLGKTMQQIAWAENVRLHTGKSVLILCPLAVAEQTVREGAKLGLEVFHVREVEQMAVGVARIYITNYDRLERFLGESWGGVVLDESSILKSYNGSTRTMIIDAFQNTSYKLACTATPAPNDHTELGNHAEFLGVMTRTEMLASFFVHDGGETAVWRLKGHAQRDFWQWCAGWAIMMRTPADIGFRSDGYVLPPLRIIKHVIDSGIEATDTIFAMAARTLDEQRKARRLTLDLRCASVAQLANESDECWLVWCEMNDEGDALEKAIMGSVQVAGSDDEDDKVRKLNLFLDYESTGSQLAACGNQNTQPPDGPNITPTQRKGQEGLRSPQVGPTTCVTITPETRINGKGRRKTKTPGTTPGGCDMHLTHRIDAEQLTPLQDGPSPTQGNERAKGCAPTGSHSINSPQCSTPSLALVQSVDLTTCQTPEYSPLLTTITGLDPSGVCCAQDATLESGICTMTHPDATLPPRISEGRVMVSKPKIFGFGVNMQHCHKMAFVGLSHSYEQFYQAIRRCWRFGQTRPVEVHVITTDVESEVLLNIERKQSEADAMIAGMVEHMSEITKHDIIGTERQTDTYRTGSAPGGTFTAHLGDCVEGIRALPDNSIHYSVFSPPFASLYTYSNSPFDMGNCKDHAEFFRQFVFLTRELFRVIMPGRLVSFHCMNLPTSKERDGFIGITDFRGVLIKAFQEAGWIFHSEVCIWKDPVTAMQRTKALGLLHKTIRKDSSMSRQGIADYLVTMRKPGENPERIPHGDDLPVSLWQRYASPVWMDIQPNDTLQKESAREEDDERHICPLQLGVIERAIHLWTNRGDTVLSPFMGIGSEGYQAIKMGRRFVGFELKESYYKQAVANLTEVERSILAQTTIFDVGAA